MNEPHVSTEEYHEPGRYEIRLKGHLDARWASRFAGLSLSHARDGTTILAGPVVDQAALYGLLRTVRDLGLPLLSVTHVERGQANGTDVDSNSDTNREANA
jgi:hypothetical protein